MSRESCFLSSFSYINSLLTTAKMKKITRLFHKACADYRLLEDGDRVLVAVSGGKDSLMLARLMARQSRILKPRIEVKAVHVVMDNIPYETDRSYLEQFCRDEGIALEVLHSSFDESTDPRKTHCFLCSWNRRKAIFNYATEHGYNKVALGHHNDDFIITSLMNMTFEGSFSGMTPIMPMRHYPLSVIRPLCLVHEDMISAHAHEFKKQRVSCPYERDTQRNRMQELLQELKTVNPEAQYSLWHAISERF